MTRICAEKPQIGAEKTVEKQRLDRIYQVDRKAASDPTHTTPHKLTRSYKVPRSEAMLPSRIRLLMIVAQIAS